ncbi:pyrimidine reductase [Rathayibacter rathayi]|uniref:Pyrimidine reductase n=1 Tax=Rathayibacter rathayi TaxID=33887 RepID=A0ABD6WBD1_RATRA|nr:dihydrofolate reductase family protein [Rathayibacter rathayi]AZZ48800.1 pyrimidine reductase [Rathayibacter rathayi]MWV73890.1 pyrimidine reductase [Rathayibacter rathayi NCPPB 2980 = VKM Ac-1601]PPF15416.1 pyrimidine reductase [Rathayibacter rathayi]PPF48800.1 pyrimidine reductase [Rathayibacter rathayi]PPF79808.1 pyrimidine reductase [Rathayibacter rathayi]
MILQPLIPAGRPIVLGEEGARAAVADAWRPADAVRVRLNMIASITGSSIGADGTSETLTNRVDRTILGVIREQADVVLVGAASVRAEGYRLPKRVPLAVVSTSGNLAGHRLEMAEGSRVLLLVPESRGPVEGLPAGVEVVAVPSDSERLSVEALLDALAARGLHRVVCEGGASLSGQFLASGRVDEFCLTTSPRVVLPGLPVATGAVDVDDAYSLVLLAADDRGAVYARWSRSS